MNRTIGVIANPASGKDIRRLVSYATTIDNNEKVNICKRIVLAAQGLGVESVVFMPETFMIGWAVREGARERRRAPAQTLELLDFEIEAAHGGHHPRRAHVRGAGRGLRGGPRRRRHQPGRGQGPRRGAAALGLHGHEQRLPHAHGGHGRRHGRRGRRADAGARGAAASATSASRSA